MHLTFHTGTEPLAARDNDEVRNPINRRDGNVPPFSVVLVARGGVAMARQPSQRRWSAKVTETSDALDLEDNIF
jgi:hypothetical protein